MLRIIAQAVLLAGVLALGACGFADSRAPVPEFMRIKEAEQAPPESPPDVKRVVREQIEFVFLSTSNPREVHVATPHREVRGPGWTACVRAPADLRDRLGARRPDLHRDHHRRKSGRSPARRSGRHLRVGKLPADLGTNHADTRSGSGKNQHDGRERSPPPLLVTAEGSF
ncbi:hypothetical protein [Bradyrhizobium sp. LB13.1]